MAATVVLSASTIVEVLNLYNYEAWSIRVETYLIAEGFWDIIEAAAETPDSETKDWRMKNAKALHAIQNSCGTDIFGFIRDIRMAKDAWETLSKRLKPKIPTVAFYIRSGSIASLIPSEMINLEALNLYNYYHWSFWMKTYLLAEDLWGVVEDTNKPPREEVREGEAELMAWRQKNARALHVITIFCGEGAASSVSDTEKAKDAWNLLAKNFKSVEVLVTREIPEVDSNDDTNSMEGDFDLEIEVPLEGQYKSFFEDVDKRDWEAAKQFLKQHPDAVRRNYGYNGMRALQSVVWCRDVDGVKVLLPFMKGKDLEILDNYGHTALSLAILSPDTDAMTEIIKCIVEKKKKLLLHAVDPSANTIPLIYALSLFKPKMARYLYSVTPLDKLKSEDGAELVSLCFRLKLLDMSLDLLRRFPNLIITEDHSGASPLNELASTRDGLFENARRLGIWSKWIYNRLHVPLAPQPTSHEVSIEVEKEENDQGNQKHLIRKVACFFGGLVAKLHQLSGIDGIYQMKLLHVQTIQILKCLSTSYMPREEDLSDMQHKFVAKAIFQAAERGHSPLITFIISWFPERFLKITDRHDKTVFQFAVEQRQDDIFDLMQISYDEDVIKDILGRKDKFGNNMLHVVGKLSPLTKIAHIRGAALQMQSELKWFKRVESMAHPKDLNCINSDGLTPREVFTMNHRDLVKEGQSAMKETATSSSFVGALIITIMFTAAVTVPGGIKGDTGIPIQLDTKAFQIFIVANVISLCCSTTSVLASFGILTSHFAEEDFFISLPIKLIFGLFTLFLSIAGMMVAFSTAIFIILPEKQYIVIPSICLTSVPIGSFLWMEGELLFEIIISTYGFKVFKRRPESLDIECTL